MYKGSLGEGKQHDLPWWWYILHESPDGRGDRRTPNTHTRKGRERERFIEREETPVGGPITTSHLTRTNANRFY